LLTNEPYCKVLPFYLYNYNYVWLKEESHKHLGWLEVE